MKDCYGLIEAITRVWIHGQRLCPLFTLAVFYLLPYVCFVPVYRSLLNVSHCSLLNSSVRSGRFYTHREGRGSFLGLEGREASTRQHRRWGPVASAPETSPLGHSVSPVCRPCPGGSVLKACPASSTQQVYAGLNKYWVSELKLNYWKFCVLLRKVIKIDFIKFKYLQQ